MAQLRVRPAELARLFNAVDRPVYILDHELTIRFFNKACLEWLGADAARLLGRRCTYRSAGDGTDQPAADLCPPPVVFEGRILTDTVAVTRGGEPRKRRARFVPIGTSPRELLAVVALVEPADWVETDAPAPSDQTDLEPAELADNQLHDLVRRFRHEVAGRCGADRLVGNSPAMRLAQARIELATAGWASVLVVGPVGSGRQHVAHAIHYGQSRQHEGTLIPVDCAVLGADLIRSTIQALANNPLGQRARRSTLLLGEVDLMPPEVQPDVAAALAGASFLPRVVSTTTVPLESLATSGAFRPELAALLSTIVIDLPPLAQRREDIPPLAQWFLEEANGHSARQLSGLSPEALDRLDAYDWPGNVDELAAVVAEAHARAGGPRIEPADLPNRLRRAADAMAHPPRAEETIQLDAFLARIERELLARAMAQAKGNKTKAASLLGMTRPRLYRRLVQLGLEEE